jgi:acyl-CoA reductase-like NAD-dependent aldehyde dehydrogenase
MKTYPMVINGAHAEAPGTFEVVNPSTEEVMALVPEIDEAGIEASLNAAQKGFKEWSAKTPAQRKEIVLKYADILDANSARIVALLREETGKPQDNAEYDFGMLTTCLRFFLEEVERLEQPVLHDPDGRFLHYVNRQPLGVVVGMLAWNFPLLNVGCCLPGQGSGYSGWCHQHDHQYRPRCHGRLAAE